MTNSVADSIEALRPFLIDGLSVIAEKVPVHCPEQLLAYLDLMLRWNKTYNLTAIRSPVAMLTQHVLDSLAALPEVRKSTLAERRLTVADVGSGAGLPAIPWAIAQPLWSVASIEVVEKKAAFQRQVKIELGLNNLNVYCQRAESCSGESFDLVVSRAFASLDKFVKAAGHLVGSQGMLFAMKGAIPRDEIQKLPPAWRVEEVRSIKVPMLDAQRHVVILKKT